MIQSAMIFLVLCIIKSVRAGAMSVSFIQNPQLLAHLLAQHRLPAISLSQRMKAFDFHSTFP